MGHGLRRPGLVRAIGAVATCCRCPAAAGRGLVNGSNSMDLLRATLGSAPAGGTEVVARYTSRDYANDCGHLLAGLSDAGTYYVGGLDSPDSTPEINVMKVVGRHADQGGQGGLPRQERDRLLGARQDPGRRGCRSRCGRAELRSRHRGTSPGPTPRRCLRAVPGSSPGTTAGCWAIDHFSAGSLP